MCTWVALRPSAAAKSNVSRVLIKHAGDARQLQRPRLGDDEIVRARGPNLWIPLGMIVTTDVT